MGILVAVLLVGIGFRALRLVELQSAPDLDYPPVDEGFSLYSARGMATGDWTLPPQAAGRDPEVRSTAYVRPPGYPAVLAGLYRLSDGDALTMRTIQMGFGLISVVLAWWIGRRLVGPAVGLTWAALMVLCWPLLYFQGGLNGAWILVLLSLVLIDVVFRLARQPRAGWAAAAGVVIGAMALVRPNAIFLAPVLLVWGWWLLKRRGRGLSLWWTMALAAAVAGAFVLLPSTLRNWRVERALTPFSANGGVVLYHGNNDDATGYSTSNVGELGVLSSPWVIQDFVARLEGEVGRDLTSADASKILGRRALRWMADHPGRALTLMGRKALLFWGPRDIAHNRPIVADRRHSTVLRWMPLGFASALGGALAGVAVLVLWFRRRTLPDGSPETFVAVGLFVGVWFISFLPFFIASLYRVPVIPMMLLASACALVEVGRRLSGGFGAGWMWPALLVGTVAAAHVPIIEVDPGLARFHYDQGLAWFYQGRGVKALEAFERAEALDPDDPVIQNALGTMQLDQGDSVGALRRFSRAAEGRPRDPLIRSNRALALVQLQRWDEAEREFLEALRWSPNRADWWSNVGVCRERQAKPAEAVDAYERALGLVEDHPTATNNLAWLLAVAPDPNLRDGERAVRLAQAAVAQGVTTATLDTLAAALAESGRFAEAVSVLERAAAGLGPEAGRWSKILEARKALYAEGTPFREGVQAAETAAVPGVNPTGGLNDASEP